MKKFIPILFLIIALFVFFRCGNTPKLPGDSGPVLFVEPQYLDFGYSTESLTVNIKNVGSGTLYWALMENYDWIDCSETEGESTGQTTPVVVQVDRYICKLSPENHGIIDVYWNNGIEQIDVLVLVSTESQIFGRVYYVIDSEELPVVGASVKVYGVEWCVTDENGWFELDYTDGDIDLSVEHPNFEPYNYIGKALKGEWPIQLIPL